MDCRGAVIAIRKLFRRKGREISHLPKILLSRCKLKNKNAVRKAGRAMVRRSSGERLLVDGLYGRLRRRAFVQLDAVHVE